MLGFDIEMDSLSIEAYQIAKSLGWWDGGRTADEVMVLIHSEISEALEDYRDGNMAMTYLPSGKPVGFPSEIADVIIRVADWLGRHEVKMGALLWDASRNAHSLMDTAQWKSGRGKAIPWWLNRMHTLVSKASEHTAQVYFQHDANHFACLRLLLLCIFEFCYVHDIQIDEAIRVKMAYNKSRPYRHGGKVI